MITLLASITGFISSLFPSMITLLRESQNKRHELAILEKQMELQTLAQTLGIQKCMDEIRKHSEEQALLSADKSQIGSQIGIPWIDALNGTVRPVLAYGFFAIYSAVKYLQWLMLCEGSAPLIVMVEILWNTEDQAIFAGIISFYYGQRALGKLTQK